MGKAILTISKLTDRVNGYGMPVVEVNSTEEIKVINRGYNEFTAENEIDESDLYRLRQYFSMFSTPTVMLEITCPETKTNCWYSLENKYLGGGQHSQIIW